MMHKQNLALLVLGLSMVVSACAPRVPVAGIRPAEVGLPGVQTLYVLRFAGDHGLAAKMCMIEELRTSDRFRVLDQEYADRPKDRWASVQGSVVSSVTDSRGSEEVVYDEVRTRKITYKDANGNVLKDSNGNPVSVIEEVSEERRERVAFVNRSIRLETKVDVEDISNGFHDQRMARRNRDIKYGGAQAHAKSSSYRADAPTLADLGSAMQMLDGYACDTGRDLARKYLPKQYTLNVTLADEGGEMVEQGVDMAERDNWRAAVNFWEQALAVNPNNAPALYNIGVSFEQKGGLEHFQQAKEFYEKAVFLDGSSLYSEGMSRIIQRIGEAKELQRQLGE